MPTITEENENNLFDTPLDADLAQSLGFDDAGQDAFGLGTAAGSAPAAFPTHQPTA